MDWFEKLTGFPERTYDEVRERLYVDGDRLHSRANSKHYGVGALELVSLQTLRNRIKDNSAPRGKLKLGLVSGDVRELHRRWENSGCLFQVASQFNLLEMTGPTITPEHGVTRYENDRTQGPACAIAAGAATIFRNYFAPVGESVGQTATRQLDGLSEIGARLAARMGAPVHELWTMQNGYAMASEIALERIARELASLSPAETDELRSELKVGLQTGIEVTDNPDQSGQTVSQVFCSALPVAYCTAAPDTWERFASLVLEAAYEATLCAAVLRAQQGQGKPVYLTLLGAGAFGNPLRWCVAAMQRALSVCRNHELDVHIVSYGPPSSAIQNLVTNFNNTSR